MATSRLGRRGAWRVGWLLAGLAVAGLLLAPAVLAAATMSVTADRSQVALGLPTVVRVTIRNLAAVTPPGAVIGCVTITMPNSYKLTAASVGSISNGSSWSVSTAANAAKAHAANASGSLRGDPADDSIVIALTVTGLKVTGASWTVEAWADTGCKTKFGTIPLKMAVVILGPTPTPKPTPTPTRTATPTRTPTPTSRPTTGPSPTTIATASPTAGPGATLDPSASAGVLPSAGPSAAQSPSPSPSPSGFGVEPIVVGPLATTRPGQTTAEPFGALTRTDIALSGMGLDLLGMLGPFVVPGFIAAASGLALLLVLLLQVLGAAVWLPIVRRRIGSFSLGAPKRAGPRQ
ncbi:MAG TPA: hypothetical protein VF323_07895 [Candidatus Limnocylindrales bacterium]